MFECRHAGKLKFHKGNNSDTMRITTFICMDCICYINICWPKNDLNSQVTTFESKHMNHNLNIATAIFAPLYRNLSESVMD